MLFSLCSRKEAELDFTGEKANVSRNSVGQRGRDLASQGVKLGLLRGGDNWGLLLGNRSL